VLLLNVFVALVPNNPIVVLKVEGVKPSTGAPTFTP